MSKIQWDSQLYLRYERERTQPSIDLLSKIGLESPGEIIDLGCGPGNSTRVLRERWPVARITGLDSSTAMIENAPKARPQSSGESAITADRLPAKKAISADRVYPINWLQTKCRFYILLKNLPGSQLKPFRYNFLRRNLWLVWRS